MPRRSVSLGALAVTLAVSLTACENATGPTARSSVFLSAGSSASTTLLADAVLAADATPADAQTRLGADAVASFNVTVTRVQALRAGEAEEDERRWIDIALAEAAPVSVNLLALPEGGIRIATDALPPGTYGNLRLFVADAHLVLKEGVTLPAAPHTPGSAAGEPIPLRIPSAERTGIKIPAASFVVAEGDESIVLDWDVTESIRGIQSTARGLQISPVLRARPR